MKKTVRAALFWSALCECVVVLAAMIVGVRPQATVTAPTHPTADTRPLLLLDAGHGGEDGGALAPDGTREKDLNLDIARDLRDYLTLCGIRVAMTRECDEGLGDGATVRERKVSDMRARLALFEDADLVLSIHQNKFGSTACAGAQFFYSTNTAESRVFAETIRRRFLALLQPKNTREIKPGGENVFLLHKTTTPAVLAECGFLSNPEELRLLKEETYRQTVAFALLAGILEYSA